MVASLGHPPRPCQRTFGRYLPTYGIYLRAALRMARQLDWPVNEHRSAAPGLGKRQTCRVALRTGPGHDPYQRGGNKHQLSDTHPGQTARRQTM